MPNAVEKHHWLQFFTGEWLNDPALSLCAPATRGIWMDLICAMHLYDRSGELRGTAEQLARLARCSTVEMVQALTDLQNTNAADVRERNGSFTVINRRMSRDARKRQGNTARQFRRRHSECRADVAQQVTPPSSAISHKSKAKAITSPPPPTDDQPFMEVAGEEVFDSDGDEWHSIDRSLRSLGLVESQKCLEGAKRNGCEPWHVGAVISHFEAFPKAWTVGLLYARIMRLLPDDDAAKGWPPPSAEHRELVEAKRPPKALGPSAKELRAQNAAALKQAEAEHGPAVDAMSDADLDAAVGDSGVAARVKHARRQHKDPRKDGLVRDYLFRRLAQK